MPGLVIPNVVKGSMVCFLVFGLLFHTLDLAEGSPYTLSDDRVRSLDITPVLGRGYSIATNSFQSTCLQVEDTTTPSYNYDYSFFDFTQSTDIERDLAGKVSGSFGYFFVKGEFSSEAKSNSKFKSNTHIVVSTMRIERYYSSLKEEMSPLSEDARTLLERQDYIGFFKSCGPNYVRSIRRAQEVTAIFKFHSSSTELASEFASSLKVSGWGSNVNANFSAKSKYSSISSSLEIKIAGFGLGLNEAGSETLVATSLDEYNEVMKFAFKSMTQSENSYQIGMIYGIEVVPWVDNTAFQVASNILDDEIEIPLSRSLMPKAITKDRASTDVFTNDQATRDKFRCKNPGFMIDKYGYCCDEEWLYSFETNDYEKEEEGADMSKRVCRPVRKLEKAIVKNNMANNGEFVARLDSIIRYRLNQLFTLERCISDLKAIPDKYEYYILKAQDNVKYDATIEATYTVTELRFALDPLNNYGLVRHMGQELDEFIDMFYHPCLAALFGTNIGPDPRLEAKYFMAYPWHNHDACTQYSCLADNMRFDRSKKADSFPGCVPSMITGKDAEVYDEEMEDGCTKNVDDGSDDEQCKDTSQDLKDYQDGAMTCWGNSNVVPVYLMDHFCMPQITGAKADEDRQKELEEQKEKCKAS